MAFLVNVAMCISPDVRIIHKPYSQPPLYYDCYIFVKLCLRVTSK